ncbi:PIR protein, partial [Plasmodium vivax]
MAGIQSPGTLGTDSIVLFSENFYNNMNKDHNDLSNYSKYCDITWGKKEHQVKEICKKYIRYLETSDELNFVNPAYDVCTLLNYWTYVKLTEIFGLENSLDDIELAFGNLQYVWNQLYHYTGKSFNHNKCKPNFETNNHKDWLNRKKLYDYYVDYNTLKNMAEIFDGNCEYYKRINDMQTIFDYFDSLYATDPEKCPPIYNVCQSYNPKNMLSTLPCHKKLGQLSALPLARNPSEDDDITQSPEGPKPIHSV